MLLQLRNLRLADRHKQLSVAWKQCDFDANPVQNWPGLLRVLQHLSRFSKICEQMGAPLPDIKPQLLFSRVSEHCNLAKVILYTWQVALTCLQVILKCITTETIGTLAAAEGQLAVQLHQLPKCKAYLGLKRAGVGGLECWLRRE